MFVKLIAQLAGFLAESTLTAPSEFSWIMLFN